MNELFNEWVSVWMNEWMNEWINEDRGSLIAEMMLRDVITIKGLSYFILYTC